MKKEDSFNDGLKVAGSDPIGPQERGYKINARNEVYFRFEYCMDKTLKHLCERGKLIPSISYVFLYFQKIS